MSGEETNSRSWIAATTSLHYPYTSCGTQGARRLMKYCTRNARLFIQAQNLESRQRQHLPALQQLAGQQRHTRDVMHSGRQHLLLKETAARGTAPQQLVGLGACFARERPTAPTPLPLAARREQNSKVFSSSVAFGGQIPGLPQLPELDGELLTRTFLYQKRGLSRRTVAQLALDA